MEDSRDSGIASKAAIPPLRFGGDEQGAHAAIDKHRNGDAPPCSSHVLVPLNKRPGFHAAPWTPVEKGYGIFWCSECGWLSYSHYERHDDLTYEEDIPPSAALLFEAETDVETVIRYMETEAYRAHRSKCFRWVCEFLVRARYNGSRAAEIVIGRLETCDMQEALESLVVVYHILGNANTHYSAIPPDAVAITLTTTAPIFRLLHPESLYPSASDHAMMKRMQHQSLKVLTWLWEMDARSRVAMSDDERRNLYSLLNKRLPSGCTKQDPPG